MSFSDVVKPGTSALVESVRKRSTPSSPSRANSLRSVIRPSSGSWSILKSPVCSTTPAPVRITTASASGIEWLTATNSSTNGPKVIVWPSATSYCAVSLSRCSRSLEPRSARVSLEPTRGMSPRSRRRYGVAPMWSSWPWVSTRASTASRRSRIGSKSGRIRSTPGWWSSGNSTPQSTISRRPSYSKTVMLRPTSPSPPSGMTRRPPAGRGAGALRSGWGWLEGIPRVRCQMVQMRPAAARPVRSAATSWSSSATSGPRTRRLSSTPSSSRAALAVVAP